MATQVQSTLGQGAEYNKFTVKSSKCRIHRDKMYLSLYMPQLILPSIMTAVVLRVGIMQSLQFAAYRDRYILSL